MPIEIWGIERHREKTQMISGNKYFVETEQERSISMLMPIVYMLYNIETVQYIKLSYTPD